jgi:hypothetical protein
MARPRKPRRELTPDQKREQAAQHREQTSSALNRHLNCVHEQIEVPEGVLEERDRVLSLDVTTLTPSQLVMGDPLPGMSARERQDTKPDRDNRSGGIDLNALKRARAAWLRRQGEASNA